MLFTEDVSSYATNMKSLTSVMSLKFYWTNAISSIIWSGASLLKSNCIWLQLSLIQEDNWIKLLWVRHAYIFLPKSWRLKFNSIFITTFCKTNWETCFIFLAQWCDIYIILESSNLHLLEDEIYLIHILQKLHCL